MIQYIIQDINELQQVREQLLALSENYRVFSILDSNDWKKDKYQTYDLIAAFGAAHSSTDSTAVNSFDKLRKVHALHKDWIFTYLSYDIKNELEALSSDNYDGIGAANVSFFTPKLLFLIKNKVVKVFIHENFANNESLTKNINDVLHGRLTTKPSKERPNIKIQHRIKRDDYLSAIAKIRQHIKLGSVYELNYCQEFYAENTIINPLNTYRKLIAKSPTPFAAFVRFNDTFILSASPERFLKKTNNTIIAQPIKGTARRQADSALDLQTKIDLQNNEKERAENIMIVDLIRNDLAHTAKERSVKLEELCAIYSFEQVHQMISTISSELDEDYDLFELLESCFPMGSMTGAPKIRAMELIEQYEFTKRGIYSGAIGYITPNGNFDFNVVIRTLIYNQANKYISFIAGGAITYLSDAEKEYEESLLKAEAIREILS